MGGKKDEKKKPKKEEAVIKEEEENNEEQDSDEEEQQAYKWWKDPHLVITKKGEKQWDTLRHNGMMFTEPYVPHGIPMEYNGKPLHLKPEEEEVATHFAKMKETGYYHSPIFRNNFFKDFKVTLDRSRGQGNHPVRDLVLCNFEPMWQWWCREREAKKNRTKEEKKADKAKRDEEEKPYKFCVWNGREQEVTAFRAEPPGLFRGRGSHPLQGKLKHRIVPEDVTINIGEGEPIPKCPEGHQWGSIVHNHNGQWLCMYKDTVGDNFKYVQLAATGAAKQIADREKFEKARRLKEHVDTIRASYREGWNSSSIEMRQLSVCMYFIDKLALRVGNEKSEEEADTVGCCSLRTTHVTCVPGSKILHFSFLGKDSIPYENDVEVDPRVYELIEEFKKYSVKCGSKKEGGVAVYDLFPDVEPGVLNTELKKFMPDLSAKVFRTYNASHCLDQWFREHPLPEEYSVHEKVAYFNEANTEVAVLCNHQKSVSKGHGATMEGMDIKLQYLVTLRDRLQAAQHAKDKDKARKKFYEEEDAAQWQWLEQYGTDEEKKDYEEYVAKRDGSGVKKEKVKKESKREVKKESTKSEKKAVKKEVKKEANPEEDEALAAIVDSKPSRKRGRHDEEEEAAAEEEVEEEEADEEEESDEPEEPEEEEVHTKKAGGKKSPAKKKSPSKKKKTPAKKAAKKSPAKKGAKKSAPKGKKESPGKKKK